MSVPRSALLLVGGAPRVPVDAVRHLSVAATGATVLRLARLLADATIQMDLLLSVDCQAVPPTVERYTTRADLDGAVRAWISRHPAGTVVMTAAVNDYEVAGRSWDGHTAGPKEKIPSGCEAVQLHLRPAPKLVDALRGWGHRGALVACKYEGTATVIASAEALRRRTGAACVVANALDGTVQALVDDTGVEVFADRESLLRELAQRLVIIAGG